MEVAHRHHFTTFKKIEAALLPSKHPHLCINFNIFIKYKNSFWIHVDQDHHPTPYFAGDGLSTCHNATAAVTVRGGPVPYDAISESVGTAVSGRLTASDRRFLIKLACDKVAESLPAGAALPTSSILGLDLKVSVEFLHVFAAGASAGDHRMVPAADSSLEMLEKHEADDRESCCCICLEDFGDGIDGGRGALRMPCSHVFHGGCIKNWLRTSHYCPICRYEMPTE